MNLEHLKVTKSKEVLKKGKGHERDTRADLKETPVASRNNLSNKMNNTVLYRLYTMYKIDICMSPYVYK